MFDVLMQFLQPIKIKNIMFKLNVFYSPNATENRISVYARSPSTRVDASTGHIMPPSCSFVQSLT